MKTSGRGRTAEDLAWMRAVGLAIALRREDLGMTQVRLAEATGISETAISKYESGTVQPMAHRLFKIAQALGCSMDVFYSEIRYANRMKF